VFFSNVSKYYILVIIPYKNDSIVSAGTYVLYWREIPATWISVSSAGLKWKDKKIAGTKHCEFSFTLWPCMLVGPGHGLSIHYLFTKPHDSKQVVLNPFLKLNIWLVSSDESDRVDWVQSLTKIIFSRILITHQPKFKCDESTRLVSLVHYRLSL
jgi:hypothetical protein